MDEEMSKKKVDGSVQGADVEKSGKLLANEITGTHDTVSTSNFHMAESSVENRKICSQLEPVSPDKSKANLMAVSPSDNKTHGTLTVICTSPYKANFFTKRALDLVTDPNEGSSTSNATTASAKIGQISRPTEKVGDSCIVESGNIRRNVYNNDNMNRLSDKTLENIDSTSVAKDVPHTPHAASTKGSTSHATEVIYEGSNSNNNNIDKPSELNTSDTHSSVDWKDRTMGMVGNDRSWCQVPQSEMRKCSINSSYQESTGSQHCTDIASSTHSMSAQFCTDKSENVLLRSNSGTGQGEASVGVQSFSHSLPIATIAASKPNLSSALQCATSYSVSNIKTVDSLPKMHYSEPPAYMSQLEPIMSAAAHAPSSLRQRSIVDIHPAHGVSGADKDMSSLNQSTVGIRRDEAVTETGVKMTSQSKSFVQHSGLSYPEEGSDIVKTVLMAPVESRTASVQPNSFGNMKDNVSSVTSANHSFPLNHPKSSLTSLTSAVQLSIGTHQSFDDKDSDATSSVFVEDMRETAPKAGKRSRSKSSKPQSQKATLAADIDDEDDNNDFIPVGMLQLSSMKRPEGSSVSVANADMHSVGKSMESQCQLNRSLNAKNEQQFSAREGLIHPSEKPKQGNEFVQEKLKQKVQQQQKMKAPVGVNQQQHSHTEMLEQKVQQQDFHQQKSQQQHELLLKLVQHAQQRQKQLNDQQQHCQQSQHSLNLAISGLAKPASFSKNQGLIIHHHHEEAKLVPSIEGFNIQTGKRGCPVGSDHDRDDKQFKQNQKLEQSIQHPPQMEYKDQEKNVVIEKSHIAVQYSQQHSKTTAGQPLQDNAIMLKESPWQVQASNIPKIAERLLQQSGNEQMLVPSRAEQLFCKTDQLVQSTLQQVSTSRSDLVTSRPITPTAVSIQQPAPSVNQQHPEIARMLNSPVSPRQQASPRQSVSPRQTISPIQVPTSSAQFVSPRQVATPHLRQPAIQRQPVSSVPVVSEQSFGSQPAGQKQGTISQQSSSSWLAINAPQPSTNSAQLVSTDHAQPYKGQTLSVRLPSNQEQFEQTRVNLNQSLTVLSEKPQLSAGTWQHLDLGKLQKIVIDGQLVAPDFSISLSGSDLKQLSPTQPTTLNQPVQSFSPGQVIHHRPPEHRTAPNNAQNVYKSQPSLSVHFSSPAVPSSTPIMLSSKVPVPSAQSNTSVWQTVSTQIKLQDKITEPQKPAFQPVNSLKLDTQTQDIKPWQVKVPPEHTILPENSDMEHQHSLTSQTHTRNRSPVSMSTSFQHQGTEKHVVEMQLYPSSVQFAQPVNTLADTKLINSYMASSAHDRNFQSIANLMEKETSLIQSLFAHNSPILTNEHSQPNLTQTSHVESQMHTSFNSSVENPKQCEDSSRIYTNVIPLYPEMRKNEGGLKVLSEIASERYQLAVAGKDDMCDLDTNRSAFQDTIQNSAASDTGVQISHQRPVIETKPANFGKGAVSHKKAHSSPGKSDTSIEDNKLADKETKDSSLTNNDTPRREVRQRKPKKPFEQDDTPVKRTTKAQQQKTISNQNQISVTPTQKRSHKKGQGKKAALAKLNQELELEETKQKFTRQTRSASESRVTENKNKDPPIENAEDVKNTEDAKYSKSNSARRLSNRLQMKDKEHIEIQKDSNGANSKRLSRVSSKVNYKEDASDSVDESISARSTRSSRHASISSVDDIGLSDTPERMTTRSKIQNISDKIATSCSRTDSHKKKSEKFTENKKLMNTPTRSTPRATVTISKLNKIDTRNKSKSLTQNSRSRSPVRPDSTTSSLFSRRMAACKALAKLNSSKSVVAAKIKRPLSLEFVEGLPQIKKRVKKHITPENKVGPQKLDKESEAVKTEASKESMKAEGMEIAKEASIPESGTTAPIKLSGIRKLKQKKGKSTAPIPVSKGDLKISDSEHDKDNVVGVTGNLKEEEKSQESDVGSHLENADVERVITKSEVIKTKVTTNEETTISINDSKEKAEQSEIDRKADARSPEVVTESELKSAEQHSVIRCTTAVSGSVIQAKEFAQSSKSSSACAETLPDDSHTKLPSERPKMVMYKLVPVQEENMSDVEDCLVPIFGYYVPGGSGDRILLPHNFMHGSTTRKISSSIIQAASISVTTEESTSGMSLPSGAPDHSSPSKASALTSQVLTRAFSPQRTLQCSTTASTLPSTVWSSPHLSTASSVVQTSTWATHFPQTPPLSVGDPSSVVVPKKSWTSAPMQASPSQYRSSPSWNATPPSMPSSSPLPTSSSAWNSSSSTSLPALSQQRQEHQQSWTAPSHHVQPESSWSSSSVTAAAIESWSKEFFPGTVLANALSQRHVEPVVQGPTQSASSSIQNVPLNSGYRLETGASQQSHMYASSIDPAMNSSMLYSAGASQEPEFAENRQDSVIQGYLRQVPSNPGGFSQELAGFNLGQQDLAYLENRLRQTLSPNTLFSAVAAYEDTSGHGAVVSHDNSLEESINLVHTVNLDMEEGNLDSSGNLDLADLGNSSSSAMNVSRSFDRQGANRSDQKGLQATADNAGGASDLDSSIQKEKAVLDAKEAKSDNKKPARERKSQYEIVIKNDVKRYRCLICGKNFGVATIYRHLRIHDPDYKVACNQCGKQYTQQQSLVMHWWKVHGMGKNPKNEELPGSEQESLAQQKSPGIQLKSPNIPLRSADVPDKSHETSPMKSPSEPFISSAAPTISTDESAHQRRTSYSTSEPLLISHDGSELSKQQAAHKQVEELRRLKAEKKHAASQKKAEALDDGVLTEEDAHQSTSNSELYTRGDTMDNSARRSNFTTNQTELSSVSYKGRDNLETSYPGSAASAALTADFSRASSYPHEDYGNQVSMKAQGATRTQFQFNSPHAGLQTVPQFHADNIPKPISTPMIKTSLSSETDSPKEIVSSSEGSAQLQGDKHVCEICKTTLNTKNGYILHMRRHSKVKTKFCSYCNKGFHTGQELRSHERTHTGEKPYKCEICHTCFAHSGSFVSHKKSHEKRGERDPFPIVDGNIMYPSTFKKPRLSGPTDASGEKPRRVKKPKLKKATESVISDQSMQQQTVGSQQTSVIRRNNLDNNLSEHSDSFQKDIDESITGRWQSLSESRLNVDSFRSSVGSPSLSDHSLNSSGLQMVASSQDRMSQEQDAKGYTSSGGYPSSSGNNTDYYSNSAGYSQSSQQREFLSPNVDASSSPHEFYKQDKYYPRSSSVDTYPIGSRSQTVCVPVNLAVEKNQQFSGSHNYSDNDQATGSYYSPQQQPPGYHYNIPSQGENIDYHHDDFDDSLGQYKNDPSSSEIVKKLLQHYNVPDSTFHEAVPLDYSHQMQDTSEYNRIGHHSGPEYNDLVIGASTPAPPPYNSRMNTQEKNYYSSQSATSDYDSNMDRQQLNINQDQPVLSPNESQQLQSHFVQDGRYGTPQIQGHAQDVYGSKGRYSTPQPYQETHFSSSSISLQQSPQNSQSYEVASSLSQEYYPSQPLPKFESLARDSIDSPSTKK